jgi:hypothetical protein
MEDLGPVNTHREMFFSRRFWSLLARLWVGAQNRLTVFLLFFFFFCFAELLTLEATKKDHGPYY